MFGNIFDNIPESELAPTPYHDVISRPEKTAGICICTPVTWEGAPEEWVEFQSSTAGTIRYVKKPLLPRGYVLEWHDSWADAFARIYSQEKVAIATFDEIDAILKDLDGLEKSIGVDSNYSIYDDRRDYSDWAYAFEDAWDELLTDVQASFDAAIAKALPHKSGNEVIGNRVMPPDKAEAMMMIIRQLAKDHGINS